jgi:hypothetical protein
MNRALNFKVLAWTFTLFSLIALCAGLSYGQAIDGNIVGTVLDSQGAAVVGADVTATNLGTNVTATTKSGSSGEYRFEHLLVGTYRVTAKMTGFKTINEQVNVELNRTGTRNLTLTPGATSETIEVSGVAATLDTSTPQIQSTFDSALIADSPITSGGSNTSGVLNLSLLNAGVASSGGIGLGTGPSISGQRPRNNNFTVEGVDNNNKGVTGPLLLLPNDAVDQFTVLQNQFSPEFGHSSGGQFNETIKSGTNQFHGRLYEYFQNRNLNAQDELVASSQRAQGFTPSNTRYDNNRFGGQIGGPIFKDKLFFFTDWEYNPIGNTSSMTGCAPTGAGYAILAATPGVSATNLQQFQLQAGAAPAAATATDLFCAPSTTVAGAIIPTGDVGFSGATFNNWMTGVQSLDWNISEKDQIRGRYGYARNNQTDNLGDNGSGFALPQFWTVLPQRYHLFTFGEYHNFTPSLTNEFRVGFNRFTQFFNSGNHAFPGLDSYPNLLIGFGEGFGIQFGADPNSPQFAVQNTYQAVDNVSWVKGKHSLKFGAEYREYITPQGFTQRKRGDYDWTTFDGYFTDQVPDFLAERSVGSATYYGNQNAIYVYGNDEWRIRNNFSISAGLRYEFTQVPLSERQWQPLNAISNVPGLITFGAPQAQKTNFAPRVGFAWSPESNTSIRAGYALAYDVLFDNLGLLSAPPQVQQTCDAVPGDQSGATPSCFWGDPSLGQNGFLASGGLPFAATIPPITDPAVARASTGGFIPKQELPYSETWTLGVQHVFASKYVAEIRYVGTRGIHLPVQDRINRQPKVTPNLFLPTYLSAPSQATLDALPINLGVIDANPNRIPAYLNAGFLSNITAWSPTGGSRYNGLQAQVSRNFTNNLQFQAAWTWSHNIDNSTAEVFSTYLTPRRPQDSRNMAADYSDSALDRRHRFTIGMIYNLPFFKGGNWLEKNVIGNWEFAPSYTFQSPEFATVQSGGDSNLNGDAAGDRTVVNTSGISGTGSDVTRLCNSSGLANCNDPINPSPDSTVVGYLATNSTAQYIVAGPGALATARRNTLALPHINNFDFAILKRFNITERQSFEFSAQASNVFNHAQYLPGYISDVAPLSFTGTNVLTMLIPGSPSFNQPKSVFTNHPRNMLLTVKYNF